MKGRGNLCGDGSHDLPKGRLFCVVPHTIGAIRVDCIVPQLGFCLVIVRLSNRIIAGDHHMANCSQVLAGNIHVMLYFINNVAFYM